MGAPEQTAGEYAVLLTRGTDDVGAVVNALRYTVELTEHGHDAQLFFDGAATQWPGVLLGKHGHPGREQFVRARDRGLVGGACGFCADRYDAAEDCEAAGVTVLGSPDEHAPDVGALATDGVSLVVL